MKNKFAYLAFGIFLVVTLAAGSVLAGVRMSRSADPIPAAAAAEANLVCSSFQGLETFVVTPVASASAPEGTFTKFRVTATCKSEHTVTGLIELLKGAQQ